MLTKQAHGQGDKETRGHGEGSITQSPNHLITQTPSLQVSVSPCRRTLVLGLGNPILGDDGVGWRVAERCAERIKTDPQLSALASEVEVDCHAGGGLSLVERLIGYEQVILIDAICSGTQPPGGVTCFPLKTLTNPGSVHTSSPHDTSLLTALELGRRLGAGVPERVIVVAVEAQNLYEFSEELSSAVQAAVAPAAERVQELLVAWTE